MIYTGYMVPMVHITWIGSELRQIKSLNGSIGSNGSKSLNGMHWLTSAN